MKHKTTDTWGVCSRHMRRRSGVSVHWRLMGVGGIPPKSEREWGGQDVLRSTLLTTQPNITNVSMSWLMDGFTETHQHHMAVGWRAGDTTAWGE